MYAYSHAHMRARSTLRPFLMGFSFKTPAICSRGMSVASGPRGMFS